ncbi:MAG: DUF1073 domain-containing protein [Pseudomonadota bacterium]
MADGSHNVTDGLVSLNMRTISGNPYAMLGASGQRGVNYDQPFYVYENLYRSDPFARQIIDAPVEDATREWRVWSAEDAGDVTAITDQEERLRLAYHTSRAMKAAGLYGGAALIMYDAGEDLSRMSQPWTPGTEISALRLAAAPELTPEDANRIVLDANDPNFEYPEMWVYSPARGSARLGQFRVHHTRIAFFRRDSMDFANRSNMCWWWGDSALRPMLDDITDAKRTRGSIADLVEQAKADTLAITNLAADLSTAEGESKAMRYGMAIKAGRQNNGLAMIDKNDELHRDAYQFGGLKDISEHSHALLAAAADIPITRLMGRSPAGQNATGESDLVNYDAALGKLQTELAAPGLAVIDAAMFAAAGRSEVLASTWNRPNLTPPGKRIEQDKVRAETFQTLTNAAAMPPRVAEAVAEQTFGQASALIGVAEAYEEWRSEGGQFDDPSDPDPEPPEPTDPASGGGSEDDDEGTRAQDHRSRPQPRDAKGRFVSRAPSIAPARLELEDMTAMRTLYASRKLLETDAVVAWARSQGFAEMLAEDELHVTLAFSMTPVNWAALPRFTGNARVSGVGRVVKPLGDKGAVVLGLVSEQLTDEWERLRAIGADWKWADFQPHMTLTYRGGAMDLSQVEPFTGELLFGPMNFEQIVDDWDGNAPHVSLR